MPKYEFQYADGYLYHSMLLFKHSKHGLKRQIMKIQKPNMLDYMCVPDDHL